MHATRPVVSLRLLMPMAVLTLLARLLLLPDQTHAQNAPTIGGSTTLTSPEGTATTMVLAAYMATTADMDTLTWMLEGNDADDFTITANPGNTGELKFANVPNFESPTDSGRDNVYNVTVKVTDDESPAMTAELPVTVTVNGGDKVGRVGGRLLTNGD